MQYYQDGFYSGDPSIKPPARTVSDGDDSDVDVLIVGAGPAGLVLASVLAQFPDIRTRIIERQPGPIKLGQADGIACRTVEMFQAFGFADQLLAESYWVNETSFWRPDPSRRENIVRTDRVQDVEDDLSEMPHVIMNQARIHEYLLTTMRAAPTRLAPDFGVVFQGLNVPDDPAQPVEVTVLNNVSGAPETIRARFVIGCDGARSSVRDAIARTLSGDRANHAWGVLDVLAVSDFPDLRLKAAIQSSDNGSILLLPREGGHLVRLYVDLGVVNGAERERVRAMSVDDVLDVANQVLRPYTLEIRETVWFSVYEVAQRIADAFDDAVGRGRDPRVFIAGDACHTHSAKAGLGMNVSMQDGFNLAWKLASVIRGRSGAEILRSYDLERRPIAQELIDFDREWAELLATPPRDPEHPERGGVDSGEVSDYFTRHGRYTAGVATRYGPSVLTSDHGHADLATGLPVGMRFHSAPVVRIADGKSVQIGHAATADDRWRLYVFADAEGTRFETFCDWLITSPDSPVVKFTPLGADVDSVIDVRGILQQDHRTISSFDSVPAVLRPTVGELRLLDYEKAYSSVVRTGPDIYELRGIDREHGCVIVARPDQYVAHVVPLDGQTQVTEFFDAIMTTAEPE